MRALSYCCCSNNGDSNTLLYALWLMVQRHAPRARAHVVAFFFSLLCPPEYCVRRNERRQHFCGPPLLFRLSGSAVFVGVFRNDVHTSLLSTLRCLHYYTTSILLCLHTTLLCLYYVYTPMLSVYIFTGFLSGRCSDWRAVFVTELGWIRTTRPYHRSFGSSLSQQLRLRHVFVNTLVPHPVRFNQLKHFHLHILL